MFDFDFYFQKQPIRYSQGIFAMTGFNTIKTSMGQVNNTGVELRINTVNIKKSDWFGTQHLLSGKIIISWFTFMVMILTMTEKRMILQTVFSSGNHLVQFMDMSRMELFSRRY